MEDKKYRKGSLLADLPVALDEEHFETLSEGDNFRIERIVSRGQASPADFWYDEPENEFVLLVRGRARLGFAGNLEPVTLLPGEYLEIPARCRHRVEWTDPDQETVWLAIYLS